VECKKMLGYMHSSSITSKMGSYVEKHEDGVGGN
jgi:hypothetical protein